MTVFQGVEQNQNSLKGPSLYYIQYHKLMNGAEGGYAIKEIFTDNIQVIKMEK